MSDAKQIVLRGTGYSGRGVRIVLLSQTQLDTIREEAAKELIDEDAPQAAKQQRYATKQKELGVPAMVVGVTEKTGFKKVAELLDAKWKTLSADQFEEAAKQLFTPKDLDLLGDTFFQLHVATKAEVDDILGEAQDVTVD